MKKLMLFLVALCATQVMSAQKGLEITLNVTPGSSMLLNDDDFSEGENLDFAARFAYSAKGTIGFNVSESFGLYTGLGYAAVGQSYKTAYTGVADSDQHTFTRDLSYLRIPVGIRFGGDFTEGVSSYVRIGAFADMLSGAKGTYTFNSDERSVLGIHSSPYAGEFGTTYKTGETATYDYRNAKHYENLGLTTVEDKNVFNDVVLGVEMDLGSRFRINDQMGILFGIHLEGTFSNVEGEDAIHHFINTNNERASTFSVMAGFNIGFQHVIGF